MKTSVLVQILHSNVSCDLETRIKVRKIIWLDCLIPIMYLCEFHKNPCIDSQDEVDPSLFGPNLIF